MKIEIESETNDERSLFRLTLNGRLIAETLTAVQTHLLIGEIFERAVLSNRRGQLPQGRLEQSELRIPLRAA
jgi:hypothetical protein